MLLTGRASVYVTRASEVDQLVAASRPSISSATCGGRSITAAASTLGIEVTGQTRAEPGPLTINISDCRQTVYEEEETLNRSMFGTLAMNYG